jgi:hypothetical protein
MHAFTHAVTLAPVIDCSVFGLRSVALLYGCQQRVKAGLRILVMSAYRK